MEFADIQHQIMHSDRFRLAQKAKRLGSMEPLEQSVLQSIRTFESRDQSVPELVFDPDLPIAEHRDEIVQLLRTRQTIVICGETGSGKSTQLPKICLEAGLGRAGMIGHTQPRRLAARAVASRLAEELGTRIGDLVGFKIRFSDATSPRTLVKVMTDGVLLAETQNDRYLEQYDVVIIDEAHERSLNIDFLLGYLKKVQSRRPELKLIITSATIDPQRFADHFADEAGAAPVLEVSGRTYPVEVRYRPASELDATSRTSLEDEELYRAIVMAVDELWGLGNVGAGSTNTGQGDILVFLPTERDIRMASKVLRGHFAGCNTLTGTEILPLYARLSQAEQNKIFAAHARKRIVLATNVAESSLTVPGIRYVIDSGLVRLSRYASKSKVQRLPIEPISQASANQRSGRCGRLGPGVCIRLYDEADFNGRSQFTTPEIRRSDLANVLLQSYLLRLGPLDEFPLLDVPPPEAIRDAVRTLLELGAIDEHRKLTDLGRQIGRLPCDVRVGRMLLEAHQRNCLHDVLIIAAGLETNDVRQRPAGHSTQADAAHQRFKDPHSDFLSLIRLWDFYESLHEQLGRSRLQKALQQQFLSLHSFREWADIIRQLKELLTSAGLKLGHRLLTLPPIPKEAENEPKKQPRPDGYAAVHQSLLAGLLSGIAHKDPQRPEYKAAGGMSIRLWPGSGLFRQSPKWIVAAETVETSQRFGRIVAELDVEWIENAGKDLLKHSYHDPFWSEKSGAAMVYRKSTLYGLTIVSDRRTPLATVNSAMAREMLIEYGLVDGQWRCSVPFYQHNMEMLADMEELVRRTRSRQFVVDRYWLSQFYSRRLPQAVTDLNSLQTWATKNRGSHEEKALWFSPQDLVSSSDQSIDLETDYPNSFRVGSSEFPLSYHFEPGQEADGITISIPQIALRQVSEERLAWFVPGLLEDKILAMIRLLPKSLRTCFLPAPDVAKKLSVELSRMDQNTSFHRALASLMSEHSGQKISASQLGDMKLPESLRFRIRVIDDTGNTLAVDRNLSELITQYGLDSQSAMSALKTDAEHWKDRTIRDATDLDDLPEEFTVMRGGLRVLAYSAIVDTGNAVEARLVDTRRLAEKMSRDGILRMLVIKNERTLRSQIKHLPHWQQSALTLSSLMNGKQLQQALQDLIVRIGLLEDRDIPRDSITLEARQADATRQISMATQEVAEWLPQLANAYHQLRLSLERSPQSWSEVTVAIRDQMRDLFSPDFLKETPWKWLKEYPRYLHAAKLRLDKLSSGGLLKDKKLAEPLLLARRAFQNACQSPLTENCANESALEELRWALEEYQVSLFAQQLGTKITVSAKRIDEMIKRIQ